MLSLDGIDDEGRSVEDAVGETDGFNDGITLGHLDGNTLGETLGRVEGGDDGEYVGPVVLSLDGIGDEGCTVDDVVGEADGKLDLNDGNTLGLLDGSVLGDDDETTDGIRLGEIDDSDDDKNVGLIVL